MAPKLGVGIKPRGAVSHHVKRPLKHVPAARAARAAVAVLRQSERQAVSAAANKCAVAKPHMATNKYPVKAAAAREVYYTQSANQASGIHAINAVIGRAAGRRARRKHYRHAVGMEIGDGKQIASNAQFSESKPIPSNSRAKARNQAGA